MNLRAAKNELGGPPKIGVLLLVFEGIGLTLLSVLVVSFIG